jgi:hypothetical protein
MSFWNSQATTGAFMGIAAGQRDQEQQQLAMEALKQKLADTVFEHQRQTAEDARSERLLQLKEADAEDAKQQKAEQKMAQKAMGVPVGAAIDPVSPLGQWMAANQPGNLKTTPAQDAVPAQPGADLTSDTGALNGGAPMLPGRVALPVAMPAGQAPGNSPADTTALLGPDAPNAVPASLASPDAPPPAFAMTGMGVPAKAAVPATTTNLGTPQQQMVKAVSQSIRDSGHPQAETFAQMIEASNGAPAVMDTVGKALNDWSVKPGPAAKPPKTPIGGMIGNKPSWGYQQPDGTIQSPTGEDITATFRPPQTAGERQQITIVMKDAAKSDAKDAADEKEQNKLENQYRGILMKPLSSRSGGLGLEDQKVGQANHLNALIDQSKDANGDYQIPRVMMTELAMGLAKLISPTGVVNEQTIKDISQRTTKSDFADVVSYVTGQPAASGTQAVVKMYKDSIDRQAGVAVKNREQDMQYIRSLAPTALEKERRDKLEQGSLVPYTGAGAAQTKSKYRVSVE